MHAVRYLSRWLDERAVIKHKARTVALVKVVAALLVGGRLSVAQLARRRAGRAYEKHHIKAVDRLVGNGKLHRECQSIYTAMARSLLHGIKQPVIVVDWADLEPGRRWAMLKAVVPVGGRGVTVYERVFAFKRYNSPSAHREFLRELKQVVPAECTPIIVTDAGFRGPWFRAVEACGWHWVGRVRNMIKFHNVQTGRWCFTDSLYRLATPTMQHLGEFVLSRRHQYTMRLYLVRAYQLRLGRPPKRGGKKPNTTMYRRLHRAPWLLATSLPHQRGREQQIKALYARRMQIEETFRDTKSHRLGLGLRYSRTRSAERLEIMLLIAALATLALWIVGLVGRGLDWTRRFQANTERRRPVLSVVFLGRQLILRPQCHLPDYAFRAAIRELRWLVAQAVEV
jgi:hypothetical protein